MTRKMMLYMLAFCLVLAVPLFAATYHFRTINPFHSVETSARGINDRGDVVGDFATNAQENDCRESGFLLHEGRFEKINVPFKGAIDTDANGISNEGDVVGTWDVRAIGCSVNSGQEHGYVFSEGKYFALPDVPGDRFPDYNAINDEGEIVGVTEPNFPFSRGFLLEEGVFTTIDCAHDRTEANGINDDGDIVGECTDFTPYAEHGFLLRDGKFWLIDFPGAACSGTQNASGGTVAYGINEDGDIAGTYTDSNCNEHGFVVKDFPEHPKWKTVDAPGASDTKLAGINDDGELAGTTTTNNRDKGFKARKED